MKKIMVFVLFVGCLVAKAEEYRQCSVSKVEFNVESPSRYTLNCQDGEHILYPHMQDQRAVSDLLQRAYFSKAVMAKVSTQIQSGYEMVNRMSFE